MTECVEEYIKRSVEQKGWYGSVVLKVEDGQITRVETSRGLMVKEIPKQLDKMNI